MQNLHLVIVNKGFVIRMGFGAFMEWVSLCNNGVDEKNWSWVVGRHKDCPTPSNGLMYRRCPIQRFLLATCEKIKCALSI